MKMGQPKPILSGAQAQRITVALKNILEFYPRESCLRELMQNADDAGATEIEFILDTKTYPAQDLLHPDLKEFQGPSLLARNNQLFTLNDIKSLSKTGQSLKSEDFTVTGKFGKGFNSVYHYTDVPSIYSENRLLVLDPHHSWSRDVDPSEPGGPCFDTLQVDTETGTQSQIIRNQLKSFSSVDFDPAEKFEGTIIRIPLRTPMQAKQSEISDYVPTEDDIRSAFHSFSNELCDGGLLFVKGIQKVVMRVNDNVLSCTEILTPNVALEKKRITSHRAKKAKLSSFFYIDIQHSSNFDVQKNYTYKYAVQHEIRSSYPSRELQSWAESEKLHPWVAIAAQLNEGKNRQSSGHLFSVLRLPIQIHQPVCLHGLWAIAPDRERLSSHQLGRSWNKFMFSECVISAWVNLLLNRNQLSWCNEQFRFWPKHSDQRGAPFDDLQEQVLLHVSRRDSCVWNTSFSCVLASDAFFDEKAHELDMRSAVLARVKMPIVYLDSDLLGYIRRFNYSHCNPQNALKFLQDQDLTILDDDMKLTLLEYCHKARNYSRLGKLPIWPTMLPSFTDLQQPNLFLPRNGFERNMFSLSRPGLTLDTARIPDRMLQALYKEYLLVLQSTSLRYRSLADLLEDFPNLYKIPGAKGCFVKRNVEQDHILTRIWKWIAEREASRVSEILSLGPLWLLPVCGQRLRRLNCDNTYWETPTAMKIFMAPERNEKIRLILDTIVRKEPASAPPLLDSDVLGDALPVLEKLALSSNREVHLEIIDNFHALVEWLVQAKELLWSMDDTVKWSCIRSIASLLKKEPLLSTPADKIRQLPIFRRRIHFVEQSADYLPMEGRQWCDLTGNQEFISARDAPVVPQIPGVTFICLNSHSSTGEGKAVAYICQSLRLVETPGMEMFLKNYIIPSITTGTINLSVRNKLINFIFHKTALLPDSWKTYVGRVSGLVPTTSPLGQDEPKYGSVTDTISPDSHRLRSLFFNDEVVLPSHVFYESHKTVLAQCGMMETLCPKLIIERVKFYASCNRDPSMLSQKVKCLLEMELSDRERSDSLRQDLRNLAWIPSKKDCSSRLTMCRPQDCRPHEFMPLAGYVLGILDFDTSISPSWRSFLGWNRGVSVDTLMDQLCSLLENGVSAHVYDVLIELDKHDLSPGSLEVLRSLECIPGVSEALFSHRTIFRRTDENFASRLAPYMDEVHPRIGNLKMLGLLPVKKELAAEDLVQVLRSISSSTQESLSSSDMRLAIDILDISTHFPRDELHGLLAPDENGALTDILELTIGSSNPSDSIIDNVKFVHPKISPYILRHLEIETLRGRGIVSEMDDEDDIEWNPENDLPTLIANTLARYPVKSVFNEYLANADDCGATRIEWVLDECESGPYASSRLFSDNMKHLQGTSLFVYNDQVFSENDFRGFKQIGRGGKRNSPESIGAYGLGAQSCYHFTDVPMLISGQWLLILDPQREVLHRSKGSGGLRQAGIKIKLNRARQAFPDQLAPFEGLFGFSSASCDFPGTIFRFPFRDPKSESKLIEMSESSKKLNAREAGGFLGQYFDTAKISLLFLKHVTKISFKYRDRPDTEWAVQASFDDDLPGSLRVTSIESVRKYSKSSKDTWYVLRATGETSPDTTQSAIGRLKKAREYGIATRKYSIFADNYFFCGTPTNYKSELPVTIHATFAVTGDRQTIPLIDANNSPESKWNVELLGTYLPKLYIKFLAILSTTLSSQSYYDIWPASVNGKCELSMLLNNSFWEMVGKLKTLRLFPTSSCASIASDCTDVPTNRNQHRVISFNDAVFYRKFEYDLRLENLLLEVYPNLVQLSEDLQEKLSKIENFKHLTPEYLCNTFKSGGASTVLEKHWLEAPNPGPFLILLMARLLPTSLKEICQHVNGCVILPTANGDLRAIRSRDVTEDKRMYLPSHAWQYEIFQFVKERLIAPEYVELCDITSGRKLFKEVLDSGLFNIQELSLRDIEALLRHPNCPLQKEHKVAKIWLAKFWSSYNTYAPFPTTSAVPPSYFDNMISLGWRDSREVFVTLDSLWKSPCVVDPTEEEYSKLISQIPGLLVLKRDFIPRYLCDRFRKMESSNSAGNLLKALRLLKEKPSAKFLEIRLTLENASESLRKLVREVYINQKNELDVKDKEILKNLLSFPRLQLNSHNPNFQKYVSAEAAYYITSVNMIHPWCRSELNLICLEVSSNENQLIKTLGIPVMDMKDVWKKTHTDFPDRFTKIHGETHQRYIQFLEQLNKSDCRPDAAVAIDMSGCLRKTSELFDHDDLTFQAAFRRCKSSKFLHWDVRKFSGMWINLGLRRLEHTSGGIQEDLYKECIESIKAARNTANDSNFVEDCSTITRHLLPGGGYFRPGSSQFWNIVARAQIFKVQTRWFQEPLYRRGKLSELAIKETTTSPISAGLKKYLPVSWSQVPYLENELASSVYDHLHDKASPSLSQVLCHLEYMIDIRSAIDETELRHYLKDIRNCYDYLQDRVDQIHEIGHVRSLRIWLNLETTQTSCVRKSSIEGALTTVDLLCLRCPLDPEPVKYVRPFLVPYEKLLLALGCSIVKRPAISFKGSNAKTNHSHADGLFEMINSMRKQDACIDIYITGNGSPKKISAHKVILAASSEYFKTRFSKNWPLSTDIHFDHFEYATLETVINYIYNGRIDLPIPLQDESETITADCLDSHLGILTAADFFMIPKLHEIMEISILKNSDAFIRPDNVRDVVEIAQNARANQLGDFCQDFIERNRELIDKVNMLAG